MPFLNNPVATPSGLPFTQSDPIKTSVRQPLGEALKTAVANIPVVAAPASWATDTFFRPRGAPDQSFDPFSPENLSGYEGNLSSFIDVRNAEDMAYMKAKIDRERRDRDLLANSPNGMIASIAAGVADPVNWIPVVGQAGKIYQMGRLGQAADVAGRMALTGAASAGVNEALLQSSMETRTAEDSTVSIAGTTALSGVMGGAFGAMARAMKPADLAMKAATAADEGELFASELGRMNGAGGSVGAAATFDTSMQQETLKSALGAEKLLSFQDPLMRTATSPSIETRRIAQLLAEQPLLRNKNTEGIASPLAVETRIRGWQAGLYKANAALEDEFIKYRTGRAGKVGDKLRLAFSRDADKLSMDEFATEVGKAMRRGDAHQIPEVSSAAAAMRREVFDPLKDEAIALGKLPPDVKPETAISYLTRVYDVPRIVAERPSFEFRLVQWLKNKQAQSDSTIARLQSKLNEKGMDGETSGSLKTKADMEQAELMKRLTDGDLQDIAAQITDKIVGLSRLRMPYEPVPLTRGPLKDRTLTIDDVDIEPWLHSDVRAISRIYTRTMAADVELSRAFGRADMQDQIDKIKDNYAQLRKNTGDQKKLIKLDKQERADIRDIEAMRDRLRGTFAMPDNPDGIAYRAAKTFKSLNYLSMLGNMMLSAITDIGRNVMVHGFGRVFRDGLDPLVKNFKAAGLAREEVKLAGTALDMVLNERAMSFSELTDDIGRTTRFERGIEATTHSFGVVSLMAPWNAALKQFSGIITQARILKAVANINSTGSKEIERLAWLGIDRSMATRIAKQFKQHGSVDDGVYLANTTAWTDADAALHYRAALSKEVNHVIVTPGQDKPLFMSKPFIGLIGQFKSFAISANQRILLSGLQQRDMNALSGAVLSVALGMLVYRIRTPEDKISDDLGQWVAEGFDRSGIAGTLFDANNMLERMSMGEIGLSKLTGKQMSRYASRKVASAVLGPTYGKVFDDVIPLAQNSLSGNFSDRDTHAMRSMLPFQNIFYLRSLFDAAEQGVNRFFGVPSP